MKTIKDKKCFSWQHSGKIRVLALTTCTYFLYVLIGNAKPALGDSDTVSDGQYTYYNVGVLMASHLDSPFDLERCGPAVDLALQEINERFLEAHNIRLLKVQDR